MGEVGGYKGRCLGERDNNREMESKKERQAVYILTTIISDGSKVMHSQPRLPPSCLPKLLRKHTHKKVLKQKQTKGKRYDVSYTLTVSTDPVNHISPPTDEHQLYTPVNGSNCQNQNMRCPRIKCKRILRVHVDTGVRLYTI